MMAMRTPDIEEIKQLAGELRLTLTDEEAELFTPRVADSVATAGMLDDLEQYQLPVKYPRVPQAETGETGARQSNAWAWRSPVKGAESGSLREFDVVVKDCIPVAGMPMSNGSEVLHGYVPSVDAVVVTRLLDAGATVIGAGACEDLSFCSASISSRNGVIRNPNDPAYGTGGSSSGVSSLVASGEARVGIGGDQGGSIRIPSSFCGLFGLKPTFGAVPYTGAASLDPVIDHLGPIARNTADVARVLDAIVGPWDPFESGERDSLGALAELEGGAAGVRFAILTEGFGWPEMSDSIVDEMVRDVAHKFAELGCESVTEISVPSHRTGLESLVPLFLQSIGEHMGRLDGMPVGHQGFYDVGLARAYTSGWRYRADRAWPTMKLAMLHGAYMRRHHGSVYYGKAYNRGLILRRDYDAALAKVDILVMPTTPVRAPRLPGDNSTLEEQIDASLDPATFANTAITNVTGHPSLNVPIGSDHELPIGLQLIGRRGEDALLLRAARVLEAAGVTRKPSIRSAKGGRS